MPVGSSDDEECNMMEHGMMERGPIGRSPSQVGNPAKMLLLRMPGIPLQRIAVGISAKQLLGILPAEPFSPWPADPPRWLGMVQWSGRQVPVVDLAACFGLGSSDYRMARRIAFIRCARRAVILATPAMGEVQDFDHMDEAQAATSGLSLETEFVRGVFNVGSETLIIPDLDAVWEKVIEPAGESARKL